MSTFDAIRKQIDKELEEKENQNPVAVASKPTAAVDSNGMPDLTIKSALVGTVISKPGTEKVILDAATFQFMECSATGYRGYEKKRYCFVEKGKHAQYGNQYINSAGERVHVLTHELYTLLLGIISGASKQIRTLSNELTQATEMRDVYKLTIDALRKNGIID
jgi:hypothetical protein